MAISIETVRQVAKLARLELTGEEEERFTEQLGKILEYVAQLQEVDTTGLVPTSHSIPLRNVMRADVHVPSLPREDLLANAPETEGGFFRVPKILQD
ncbi:MAG: Asp-tRNA(Asn)/Glu-tRNA(Gln) amidotransferase subunit GatC [Cyanobacteria bacterium NC_groundwater_1444_Ag_S-0.65um_54_12]|nr:Asp-tRNA(Asn)/Glu-tRNA(Gln) amidotransferase subunit GatC [Cyanobacteria bacterium NC_groundwater_1444_Ag_S-0.65um_54_12]